ncbi:TonB C-terminal domain-containing protein [Psychrobacter sp. Ps3]|uniref:TonB C-terminal domain-containing protein n=1 Tax=Psychrobacter sp. Ps3 TaxID=2790957 RepID=UPI001EDD462F|nr:TonB C-terminal domain-containing protein [Psychrobacter sp. Ps3]MCG3881222.1 TonB C-terminal domain-containing protein [Psychrobacter sp. Ps3]
MNNAPLVYIPTPPDSDGLTLPTLLSLLAHGIVIGLLIYTYQQPSLETSGAIETTMVSPEQLAEMQAQILSNRAAAQAASQANSTLPAETSESTASTASTPPTAPSESATSSSQRVPVFMRSDDAADEPILMSENQQQRLAEQSAAYERNLAEWNAQAEALAIERLEQVEQRQQEDDAKERERLKEYRDKQKNTTNPRINRPSKTDRNIEIETGLPSSANKTFDLSDGQSTADSKPASTRSSASASAGDFKNSIAAKIQRNLKAPLETQGITAKVALRLDNQGNVLSAKATGANSAVNDAAEQAAFAASPLPIDLTNPSRFAALTINVMVQ